jgi:hypothetical protein
LTVNKLGSGAPFLKVGTGKADGKISITFVHGTYEGIIFRFSDTSNHWLLTINSGRYKLYKKVGGVLTQGAESATATPAPGAKFVITLAGSNLSIDINHGNGTLAATDAFKSAATQQAFWVGSGVAQTVAFKDFLHGA